MIHTRCETLKQSVLVLSPTWEVRGGFADQNVVSNLCTQMEMDRGGVRGTSHKRHIRATKAWFGNRRSLRRAFSEFCHSCDSSETYELRASSASDVLLSTQLATTQKLSAPGTHQRWDSSALHGHRQYTGLSTNKKIDNNHVTSDAADLRCALPRNPMGLQLYQSRHARTKYSTAFLLPASSEFEPERGGHTYETEAMDRCVLCVHIPAYSLPFNCRLHTKCASRDVRSAPRLWVRRIHASMPRKLNRRLREYNHLHWWSRLECFDQGSYRA